MVCQITAKNQISCSLKNEVNVLEKKYYRILNGDGTTYDGFENSLEIGGVNEAPDWDPSLKINCGSGIHVVEGHPFWAFAMVSRKNPIFIEVKTVPSPPVPSSDGRKYRCKRAMNLRILTKESPEFQGDVFVQIVKDAKDYDVKCMAVKELDPQKYAKLLARIAKKDKNWYVRWAAFKKLDPRKHAKLFVWLAKNARNRDVRQAAVEELDSQKYAKLLTQIAKKYKSPRVRQAAFKRLDS